MSKKCPQKVRKNLISTSFKGLRIGKRYKVHQIMQLKYQIESLLFELYLLLPIILFK